MRIAVVGLGLIGGSIALALRDGHDARGFDTDARTREAARTRGLAVVDRLDDVLPADAVVVATPLASVVPTLEAIVARAGRAVVIEAGSLKGPVGAFAERAREDARIVGLHPMAGSTASGFAAADPGIFRGRPFLVVPTARTDAAAMAMTGDLARELGGTVTVCSVQIHDRVIAAVSALPLATAVALARVAGAGVPMPLEDVAGPGLRDATRLASTPLELALPLLAAPGVAERIASLRAALGDIERAIGDEAALRALLDRAGSPRT
ncbi:MAG: prephenate dehydrogenase/arogenate dehydrogenase family protein [Chloroflexi bacterium]|nr:prephenate dehydrogenase/arogenate dehydrogenase family protein [Chloroflexota bacterium]